MSYERLQVTDHIDKWTTDKLKHVEDGIIANEEAIKALGNGGKADWNQNDPTASGYIENRPFYEEGAEEVLILEETEIEVPTGSPPRYLGEVYLPLSLDKDSLVFGDLFKITFNGEVYYANLKRSPQDRYGNKYLGNPNLVYGGENNSHYPFGLYANTYGNDYTFRLITREAGTYSISIYKIAKQIKKIKEYFLPETQGIKNNGKTRRTVLSTYGVLEQEVSLQENDFFYEGLLIIDRIPMSTHKNLCEYDLIVSCEDKTYNVKHKETFSINNINVHIELNKDLYSYVGKAVLVADSDSLEKLKGIYVEFSVVSEEWDTVPNCCLDLPCGIPTINDFIFEGVFYNHEEVDGTFQLTLCETYQVETQWKDSYTDYPYLLTGNFIIPDDYSFKTPSTGESRGKYFIQDKPFTMGDNSQQTWISFKEGAWGGPGAIYLKSNSSLEEYVGKRFRIKCGQGQVRKLDPMFLPQAAAVSDASEVMTAALSDESGFVTIAQFNALLKSLRDAGYLATE